MSQSARSMPRSLMRRSVLGDSGTFDLGDDDTKSTRSERGPRGIKKGRKKTRTGSLGPNGQALATRERRKPLRRASLGALDPHAEPVNRRTVDTNNKIRRVRKPKEAASDDAASDDGSKRSRKSRKSIGSKKASIRSKSKSKRSVFAGMASDDDNSSKRSLSRRERLMASLGNDDESRRSVRRERIAETKLLAITAANADHEMQEKVESLQTKIVALKQEQLEAQTSSMNLNKEKRELKLELQRSQTVVRELRAEIRDKEITVKEAADKMEALEKAVESQLDKVEDLEDELKRANDEVFTLEDKLQQMELQLVEQETEGNGKAVDSSESDFETKRRERQERRLKEKEKELEERERKLRQQLDAASSSTSFAGGKSKTAANKQLEQDNRMLLKALNREKENSAAKMKSKEDEINRLNEKITKFMEQQGDDFNKDTMQENRLLAEQLDEEKESHADTVKIKDEKISKLETELRQLRLNGSRHNPREAEAYKTEAIDLRGQLEAAQQRNNLLEDEIDNWKKKNIGLEDELTALKAKINKYRSEAGNESNNSGMNSSANLNTSASTLQDEMSVDDDESTNRRGIGKLWGRVAAMSRRDILAAQQDKNADDIVTRSTFH